MQNIVGLAKYVFPSKFNVFITAGFTPQKMNKNVVYEEIVLYQ